MGQALEVECTHLERELMRVRFATSQLISDHPREWGGTGTGPAPGEMILIALTSGSALAARKLASDRGLAVGQLTSRATMNTIQQGIPESLSRVELPHLTFVDRFWRLLEFEGNPSDEDRQALVEATTHNRIARSLANGIQLDEKLVCLAPENDRPVNAEKNGQLKVREAMAPGERRSISKADAWSVSATAVDDDMCLVKSAGLVSVISSRGSLYDNPSPEEMLLAGLASCTTIYVARNAALHNIPVQSVRVVVRTTLPDDPRDPIARIEKIAEVAGSFTEQQVATLEGFAAHCAFGLTLSRGAELVDSVLAGDQSWTSATASPLDTLERKSPTPNDPEYCADGSCCIPESMQ